MFLEKPKHVIILDLTVSQDEWMEEANEELCYPWISRSRNRITCFVMVEKFFVDSTYILNFSAQLTKAASQLM